MSLLRLHTVVAVHVGFVDHVWRVYGRRAIFRRFGNDRDRLAISGRVLPARRESNDVVGRRVAVLQRWRRFGYDHGSARETIFEGINNLNTKLNTNNVNTDKYINAEYKKTTALEMCGVKTGKFNEIGVSSENVAYGEYKALACNLHERGLLLDGDVAFDATNAAGYDQVWSGVTKSHTISLQDASGFYSMSPSNYVLPISDVSGTIDMINAMPNIDSVARCKYVQSFVAKVAAEQQDYVDPITGETIQAPDDSPLNRLLIHSETLAVAWFLIGLSYIILYVVMMKYMYWMQAEDKEKLSEEEMKEVWGSYHE